MGYNGSRVSWGTHGVLLPIGPPLFADEVTQVGSTAIDAQEEGITVPCPVFFGEWMRVVCWRVLFWHILAYFGSSTFMVFQWFS